MRKIEDENPVEEPWEPEKIVGSAWSKQNAPKTVHAL